MHELILSRVDFPSKNMLKKRTGLYNETNYCRIKFEISNEADPADKKNIPHACIDWFLFDLYHKKNVVILLYFRPLGHTTPSQCTQIIYCIYAMVWYIL